MNADRLRLLEARWRLREIEVDDLHDVADELLTAGEDSPELIELFSLDSGQLRWDGKAAFEALLRESGAGEMSEGEAAEVISLHTSRAVLAGRLTPVHALRRVSALNVRTFYKVDALQEWNDLVEELGWHDSHPYLGRPLPTIEAAVTDLARSIVKRHS